MPIPARFAVATPFWPLFAPPGEAARWLCLLLLSFWLTGCASLPDNVDRPVSTALANPADTTLGQLVAARAARAGREGRSDLAIT